jgi:hypothetical protein
MTVAILLLIFSALSFIAGAGVGVSAKSAIHEIEALVLFLISAVFLVGAAIVGAIFELIKLIKKEMKR